LSVGGREIVTIIFLFATLIVMGSQGYFEYRRIHQLKPCLFTWKQASKQKSPNPNIFRFPIKLKILECHVALSPQVPSTGYSTSVLLKCLHHKIAGLSSVYCTCYGKAISKFLSNFYKAFPSICPQSYYTSSVQPHLSVLV